MLSVFELVEFGSVCVCTCAVRCLIVGLFLFRTTHVNSVYTIYNDLVDQVDIANSNPIIFQIHTCEF